METLFAGGHYFECPRWHDGRWWVVDFYRYGVFTYDTDGREERVLEVENQPSGLGWMPNGDLLVVSMKDRRILRRSADGNVSEHADVSALTGGHLNDMIVRDGHAYAGNFGFDLMGGGQPSTATLVHVEPDGRASIAADDLWFPNGMVITDDGTLIVAETFAARFTAFTIAPDHTLTDRRIWAQVQPSPAPADTERIAALLSYCPESSWLSSQASSSFWSCLRLRATSASAVHRRPTRRPH